MLKQEALSILDDEIIQNVLVSCINQKVGAAILCAIDTLKDAVIQEKSKS